MCAAFAKCRRAAPMQVDAVVRERFGEPACRIFRLVLLKRQLEQKQIADEAMLPVKDTRELLYKLFKVEFVQLQEVARTADHSPSRTFYLWRVCHPLTPNQLLLMPRAGRFAARD